MNIAIIGGGASGMAAAISAAENRENHIYLLERQSRVGRKLLSTGNGRCNLTNTLAAPQNYHGQEPAFAVPALKRFPPEKVLGFFSALGLLTAEEYGGRVYPLSGHAGSVLDTLRLALQKPNIELFTGAEVSAVTRRGGGFRVRWAEGELEAGRVIVACGGCAGSKLGGVMDGYNILKSLGHSRTALYPALTQIRTEPEYPRALKGVKADGGIRILRGSTVLAQGGGDLLFTDTGVSGTAAFGLSRCAATAGEGLSLSIDFFRDYELSDLEKYLAERRAACPAIPANSILTGAAQSRLGQMLCRYAGVGGGMTARELGGGERKALAAAMKDFRLKITGVSGFESAQVTAGGVKTSEFDPNTLESRIVPGLFACGEVLDIDGDCGGYNLQWAWASGLLAGRLGA